jgi:hypothetical protein
MASTTGKKEISEGEDGAERAEEKKRSREMEDGAGEDQTNIKRVKRGGGNVSIQVGLWDAVADCNAAVIAYKSQSVQKTVKDPTTGKEKKVKVPCVVSKKFLANRAFRCGAGFGGDFLKGTVKKGIQSATGLDFAQLMHTPALFSILRIVTDDLPELVGLLASETTSEVLMLFADCAVADDKRRYFAAMTSMNEDAVCTSGYFEQIKCGISMQMNNDPLVNLLPPGAQLVSVILGNVLKNFAKAVLKRLISTLTAVEDYKNTISELVQDISKTFGGTMDYSALFAKWIKKLAVGVWNTWKHLFSIVDTMINDLIPKMEAAIKKLADLIETSIQHAKDSTANFLKQNEIKKVQASDFIIGEHGTTSESFESWSEQQYKNLETSSVEILNTKDKVTEGLHEGEQFMQDMHVNLDDYIKKYVDDGMFKKFFQSLGNKIVGSVKLKWEQPRTNKQWIPVNSSVPSFLSNPLTRGWKLNPNYIPATPLRHSH